MFLQRSNRHPSMLRADDALLIVIDVQEPFLRNIWNREGLLSNIGLLIKAMTALRAPIVPTLQYAEAMGGTVPEIADQIPSQYVPFDKLCFSCVGDDAFNSEIHRSGRKQILLCGIEAHICVCQTALDLTLQGYQVHVAADSVSSRTQANWEVGLQKMERAGVLISSAEMALYEMLTEAGTPEFREILGFVKAA